MSIYTAVVEHGDIAAFLQQPQQAARQKTEELLLWKTKLRIMKKCKIVELYYFSCGDKIWKYSEHSCDWNTVDLERAHLQSEKWWNVPQATMILKKNSGAEKVLWICRLSHGEMKAIILKIFMNLLNFTYESHPVLIFCINLLSGVIHFQPGTCWTIHFKYMVWWI